MLPVVEMFGPTIQGEGKRAGQISYFIRFGGCNFTCSGFGCEYETPQGVKKTGCDSWYAVDGSFKKEWDMLGYPEIAERMASLISANHSDNNPRPDIVVTGGEPLLYWNNKEFQNFLIYFISRGHMVTIETNGSLDIAITEDYQKKIIFSMSVKLSNSGEPEHKRINIDALSHILSRNPDSYLKFVVDKEHGAAIENEIKGILKELPYYADIYLMPMGENRVKLAENTEYVAEMVIRNGFKYSPRTHIDIWDSKKGV